MKKLLSFFSIIIALMIVVSSCDPKDPPVDNKLGDIVSAKYDPGSKSFIVAYSSGTEKTYVAVIDNTTKPPTASYSLDDKTYLYVADATVAGNATISKDINTVSQFVYDGMSLYYLWNTEITNKKPTIADVNPETYFYKILNSTDTKHGWSWITDDVDDLLKDFAGEATNAFGFTPLPLWADKERTQLLGFVRYVYPNTPATEAGIVRGNVITEINGEKITLSNYTTLFGANKETTFTVLDQNYQNPKDIKITPRSFSTDPVLFSKVYEIDGKKIAYLFYTGYKNNYNGSLYKAFSEFKQIGITDLVLDLRYNPGGSVSSAIYLASLIAPESAVKSKSIYSSMTYNNDLNSYFDKKGWSRSDRLGEYDSEKEQNPLGANLNLNKIYILTTRSSASASELTTFCLRPYMNVVHIGENTAGKYTASWTIHAYDAFEKDGNARAQPIYDASKLSTKEKNELRNWAMQPIVGRYTDKNGNDFIADGTLIPNHPIETQEYNTETWKPIGDINDYLFAKAISLITGKPYTAAIVRSASRTGLIDAGLHSPAEQVIRESVNKDNIRFTPEDFQEIMKKLRSAE